MALPPVLTQAAITEATPCRSARAVHDRSCPNYTGFRTPFDPTGSTSADEPSAVPTGKRPTWGLKIKTGRTLQRGTASWYGPGFHGRLTASGERFDMHALTAAHKTLPFGTRVLVHNERNGRKVLVRINDRGPFVAGRVIDLSRAAAQQLGMLNRGHDQVVLHEALG